MSFIFHSFWFLLAWTTKNLNFDVKINKISLKTVKLGPEQRNIKILTYFDLDKPKFWPILTFIFPSFWFLLTWPTKNQNFDVKIKAKSLKTVKFGPDQQKIKFLTNVDNFWFKNWKILYLNYLKTKFGLLKPKFWQFQLLNWQLLTWKPKIQVLTNFDF